LPYRRKARFACYLAHILGPGRSGIWRTEENLDTPRQVSPLIIRVARPDELDAVVSIDDDASVLYTQAGTEVALPADHPFVVAERGRFRDAIDNERLHLAVRDGVAVAFMALSLVDGAPYLDQLSVRSDSMRSGIGTQLVRFALRQGHPHPLWLTTYAHLPWNRPYYERFGFCVAPEHQDGPELREILRLQRETLPDPHERVAMVAGMQRTSLDAPR